MTTASHHVHPSAVTRRRAQLGPPLLVPVLAYVALTIAYVAVNASTPQPTASGAEVLRHDLDHAAQIKAGAFLLFASASPLAVTAAVLYRRLRTLGVTAPGGAISLVGGVLAASALALSGMFAWTGARLASDASPALARVLADLSFAAGGPGFSVTFALLIAGVSVPGLLARLLPRPLAVIGLVIAVVGALSSLTFAVYGFTYLVPVVRFGGTLWLIATAALLPRTRRPAND
ncbi:hypothetical protein [Actinomadura rupiterrae]|uniref:hypothetical protein n=1 Tax=Actinomadura rupiterrae TaxID=559627 RepID=UPI0020A43499|nr:hypothetical protein [Actinomadura rupiterrae]MCP2340330.1 hypothetical protein [Actinomadura rupiterrae]